MVVLAGPSGVGKSTVVSCVREQLPDLFFSVSATTRAARAGEVDGEHYRFVSRAEFDAMIAAGEFLEWAEIHRGLHRSGTPKAPVLAALAAGHSVLLELDLAGARNVMRSVPDALSVFMQPPTFEDLAARIMARGSETPETMGRRLETARIEMAARTEFDLVVINDEVKRTCDELVSLLVGPSSRTTRAR
ncbi:guanylate kinase [Skermania piniformis]|uniref:Guanylate kinase n=1 Tax=Skermania pinensis TaxID=39122 RepID=A0ABX8SF69_9ACTN|nr:guanylate kinase [Skermania piniformis]